MAKKKKNFKKGYHSCFTDAVGLLLWSDKIVCEEGAYFHLQNVKSQAYILRKTRVC